MPATYTPIATTTLGSTSGSVAFNSIPGTYTDLRLVIFCTGNMGLTGLKFNGTSSTLYSYTRLRGNGTTASSDRATGQDQAFIAVLADNITQPATITADLMSYANSTTNKTVISRTSATSTSAGETQAIISLWRQTAAITSFNVICDSGVFGVGSTFTLYGIAAA